MVPVLFNLLHAAMLDYATRDLRVDIRIYFGKFPNREILGPSSNFLMESKQKGYWGSYKPL